MKNNFSEAHREWINSNYGISIEDAINSTGRKRDKLKPFELEKRFIPEWT